jgi:hypothetical protein
MFSINVYSLKQTMDGVYSVTCTSPRPITFSHLQIPNVLSAGPERRLHTDR